MAMIVPLTDYGNFFYFYFFIFFFKSEEKKMCQSPPLAERPFSELAQNFVARAAVARQFGNLAPPPPPPPPPPPSKHPSATPESSIYLVWDLRQIHVIAK